MSKELRKKQKGMKENAGDNVKQRTMFVDLKRLLALKVQCRARQNRAPIGAEDGVFDLGQDIGGANVMTIEQGA